MAKINITTRHPAARPAAASIAQGAALSPSTTMPVAGGAAAANGVNSLQSDPSKMISPGFRLRAQNSRIFKGPSFRPVKSQKGGGPGRATTANAAEAAPMTEHRSLGTNNKVSAVGGIEQEGASQPMSLLFASQTSRFRLLLRSLFESTSSSSQLDKH